MTLYCLICHSRDIAETQDEIYCLRCGSDKIGERIDEEEDEE